MRYQDLATHTKKLMVDDYFNWDAQLAKAQSNELNALEIAQVINSFSYLRNLLGENYPQECFENNNAINHYLANRAPWTRIWFNWLAEAILEMSSSTNIESLLKKLKSHKEEDFFEARSIFEVGLKIVKAGFAIQIESKVVNDKGQKKKPDLTITNPETGEQGLIEVTRLTKDPASIKYESIMQKVFFGGLENRTPIQFAGRLLKDLSNEHFQEIEKAIDSKLKKCIEAKTFQEVYREGIIEFAFAPTNDSVMKEWAESKKYDLDTFSFPQTDALSRIRAKIIHKQNQLSSEHPSILVIRNEDFFITSNNYESIQEGLLETIYKCPQLLALVLISGEMGSVEKTVSSKGFNFYMERTERYAHSTKTLMLFNRFCKTKITPHTLMRIFDAFEKY